MDTQEQALLINLAKAEDVKQAGQAIKQLQRNFGYRWRAVGDSESNYGLITIGSDPGLALIERVTNAIDAVIEREALRQLPGEDRECAPASPREAVDTWFHIEGGRVANVGIKQRQELANDIVIRVLEGSSSKRRPTVEVRDRGIGLTAQQVPDTILSLGGSNKLDKPYVAGAYGQGGSTVLAFSPNGTRIVSRRQPDLLEKKQTDQIAITFAEYEELDPGKNKNGRYSYLVDLANNVACIPHELLNDFEAGTQVTHFDLQIEQYSQRLTQLTGSLWWLLQNSLFDPILPIWAEEHRATILRDKKIERRTIAGNYTRLMDQKNELVDHADSVDVMLMHPAGRTSIRANYWVLQPGKDTAVPIASYVDQYKPIAYTFFGQTHGTDERRLVSERLQLPYLSKYLIVQVELDNLIPSARRDLFSSTRDRLRRVDFFHQLREEVCRALSEDEELIRLNEERREHILSRHSEKDRQKMRERFAQLMERLKAGTDTKGMGRGLEKGGRKTNNSRSRKKLEPLPTTDEPTFLKIVNVQKPIPIHTDRHALIRLESDAPDGYLGNHIHASLHATSEPPDKIELESRSDFKGGRSRLTIRAAEGAKAGTECKITVFLFKPDRRVLTAVANCVFETPKEHPTEGDKSRADVKVPDPIPVYKNEWEEFGWTGFNVADVREDHEGAKIYVNADNDHLTKLLKSGRYQEQGITRMRNSFVLYTAFYAWMQHVAIVGKEMALQGQEFEDYQDQERDRLAQTVIHSISGAGRISDDD